MTAAAALPAGRGGAGWAQGPLRAVRPRRVSTAGLEGTGVVLDLREHESALECGEQSYGVVVSVDGGQEVPGGLEPLQAIADGG
jgi:hypothetical protein